MASDLLRTLKNDLLGRGFSNFIVPEDHRTYFAMIRETVNSQKWGGTGEVQLLRGRTEPFYAQIEVAPSRGGSGKLTGWRIAFLEISDRKHAEEQLKHYAKELERSNRDLEEFAFIASHDLQEPLRKIQSFSNMAIKRIGQIIDSTSLDHLKRVQNATARTQEILRALLKFSRITAQPQPFVECNLQNAVEDVVSELDFTIARAKGRVEITDLPVIQADTAQIRQLFQNLISNALKFHRDDTQPVVRVYPLPDDMDKCSIVVEDNGIGFEEEFAEKIFAPFQRLHGKNSRFHGTGMGLAICRKIVERHGGTITAKSQPGNGSTFIVSLPWKQSPPGDVS